MELKEEIRRTKERIQTAKEGLLSMQRHSWEQGLAMQAFYETGDMETVSKMAVEAVYRAIPDGRCAIIGVDDAITDPASVGEALFAACQETGDPFLIEGEKKLRNWALKEAPGNRDGIVYHLTTGTEFWADSFYMLPPYLAAIGEVGEAMKQFYGYWNALYDKTSGLLIHMWDDMLKRPSDQRHWGIGNGWCLMAIARLWAMIGTEPSFTDIRADLAQKGKALLLQVLTTRTYDGRFHDILDDPDSFEEVGIAQMCAYTIYRAIRDGWIFGNGHCEPAGLTWRETADTLRKLAEGRQDVRGFVWQVCGAPSFDKSGIAPEQQAIFIMMEQAYLNLLG